MPQGTPAKASIRETIPLAGWGGEWLRLSLSFDLALFYRLFSIRRVGVFVSKLLLYRLYIVLIEIEIGTRNNSSS